MHLTATKPVFDYMFKHLIHLHDNKIRIVNTYFCDYEIYMQMLTFVKKYIKYVDDYLCDVSVEDGENKLPFVIFDSVVHLTDSDTGEILVCSVTLPHDEKDVDYDSRIKLIPCCTPEASELIFKTCGESVVLDKAGERKRYKIKSIEANPKYPIADA